MYSKKTPSTKEVFLDVYREMCFFHVHVGIATCYDSYDAYDVGISPTRNRVNP